MDVVEEDDSSDSKESKELRTKGRNEEDEDAGENAYEDKKAAILLSKEEAEHALFKRIFQTKIKAMTCRK